ncbi:MAG TPA: MFS transporter [Terriglobales bacterium]|nr:MFS transporter [Terriglobales bacterium]
MSHERISVATYWRLARHNANFRRLWLAQIVSEMGDWFYALAVYSLLLEFTGRAESVALALVLQVFPQTLFGPTSGVVNDRLPRRQVMIASDLVRAAVVLVMLLVRSREMVTLVYPLLALESMMAAMFEPARTSVIPNLVRRPEIIVANTLSATTWSFNLAMGSTLGGLVAAALGRDAVFILNGASFLVSAWLIARMRFAEPHTEGHPPFRLRDLVDFTPIAEGIRYVRGDARLATTLFVKSGLGIVGASWVLFPVMGRRMFPLHGYGLDVERGAMLSMSLLLGARGVGALIGPLAVAPWAQQKQPRLRLGIVAGLALAGLGYALLSRAPNLPLACAAVALGHVGASVVWVFSTTLLQLNVEDRFRGRVFAAELGFAFFAIGTGAWLAGRFIDRGVALPHVALAIGVVAWMAAALWALAQRAWKRPTMAIAGEAAVVPPEGPPLA